ncbi:MAG: phage holin family protein [Chitinophagales bacterium]|nr:phage holin family protein [Chitinophagales bacterium]MDW8273228.1 phage holin family protein [Chitinophagales bacterium]
MQFIIKIFLNSLAVLIAAQLLPGVQISDWSYAILLAAVLAVLNASVKPILIFLTLPFTLITLGLFLLVINASIVLIADWLIGSGFEVRNFWWALLFSVIISILNSLFEKLVVKEQNTKGFNDSHVKIFDKDGNRIA